MLGALEAAGAEPLVFKGAAFHLHFHGKRALGMMRDLDLLVPESKLEATRGCLSGLGYRQAPYNQALTGIGPPDSGAVRAYERAHYELYPFKRIVPLDLEAEEGVEYRLPLMAIDGRLHVAIEVDVHHGVATNIPGAEFFERATREEGVRTMSAADALWFTTSRFYTEVALDGKRSLRDFAYLLPLLSSGRIEWPVVVAANERYLLHPSLYYYLSFMNWLGEGRLVPADVLEAVSPLRGPRRRDWGWQLGVLFDELEPFPLGVRPAGPAAISTG